jgi:hypothetical protein
MRLDQPSRVGRLLAASTMALLVTVGCQALPLVQRSFVFPQGRGTHHQTCSHRCQTHRIQRRRRTSH